MGFFFEEKRGGQARAKKQVSVQTVDMIRKLGCKACPLNNKDCRSPKMKPVGPRNARIYVLGTNPTSSADAQNNPAIGAGFDHLRTVMRKARDEQGRLFDVSDIRFSNIVRTANGGKIDMQMVEACRQSVADDIVACNPELVIVLGEEPLRWALDMSGINKWSGRHVPAVIGGKTFWIMPLLDPLLMLRKADQIGFQTEELATFAFQLRAAGIWLRKAAAPAVHSISEARSGIRVLAGENAADELLTLKKELARYASKPRVGFDYETNRLRGYNRGSRILSFAISDGSTALAVALDHSRAKWSKRQRRLVHAMLCDWLYDAPCEKVSHQLGFELEWSALFYGRKVVRATTWHDTITQAWLLDERAKLGKPDCHSLEFLSVLHYGINIKKLLVMNTDDLDNAPVELVLEYNAIDAKYHFYLFEAQQPLIETEGLEAAYSMMRDRIPCMVLTQLKGVPIHQPTVQKLKAKYESNIARIEHEISTMAEAKRFRRKYGETFQPSNPKHCIKMVEHILDKSVTNKKDKISADEEVLSRCNHEITDKILEWRGSAKVLSTYILPVVTGAPVVFEDGLLHPIIATCRTLTSRTSSEDPNQQNWPKHSAGKIVRTQVRPLKSNERVVSFDYGQIQARNIAMECLDDTYIKSFWEKHDIHRDWAHRAMQLQSKWSKIGTAKQFAADPALQKKARQEIKNNFVFPTFFGAKSRSISINTGLDQNIVDKMQDEIFTAYPGIHQWQEDLMSHFNEHGWITGCSGIKRRAPCALNQIINAPIQADEAAIVCDAMDRLSRASWKYQANMEIHDDLTFIWPKEKIDEYAPKVIGMMIDVPFDWAHCVPIVVEMSVGNDWYSLEEVGVYSSADYNPKKFQRKEYK